MIIDGRKIAQTIQAELVEKIKDLSSGEMSLHIFVVGENPVIESFVKYKKAFADVIGVKFAEHRFDADVSEAELMSDIEKSAKEASGIVVQLPLPLHINEQRVLDAVPSELDIDGLAANTKHLTPVAGAVKEILKQERVKVAGKRVLVIGKGRLVGQPVAEMLTQMGGDVVVADKAKRHAELTSLCQEADIVVSGAGVPNLVTKEMIKEGSVLLDAGTSTQAGNLVGDIALECADKASVFAKTPGGIGPMTIAILFKNLVDGALVTK